LSFLRKLLPDLDPEHEARLDQAISKVRGVDFFQPSRTLEEANSLLPKVESLVASYLTALEPYKPSDSGWEKASARANSAAIRAAENASRGRLMVATYGFADEMVKIRLGKATRVAAEVATEDRVHEVAKQAVMYEFYGGFTASSDIWYELAKETTSRSGTVDTIVEWAESELSMMPLFYILWEVIRDLPEYSTNPFTNIISILEMGLKPACFLGDRMVIDFPLTQEGVGRFLGCYLVGEGRIKHFHSWPESCLDHREIFGRMIPGGGARQRIEEREERNKRMEEFLAKEKMAEFLSKVRQDARWG